MHVCWWGNGGVEEVCVFVGGGNGGVEEVCMFVGGVMVGWRRYACLLVG